MVLALKRSRERSLKEGNGVKHHLAVAICIIFILGTAEASEALTYEFSDNSHVPVSAAMDISISGSTLHITLNNTSPVTNNPPITGFGFGLTNYNSSLLPITWTMNAYDTNKVIVAVGQSGNAGDWKRSSYNNNNIFMYALSDPEGGLYNPLANVSSAPSPVYLTAAYFDITFATMPILDEAVSPYIKITTPGILPYYVEGKSIPTPEPGTILLLGLGLIGIGIIMRELF
jgi:hypothetical protein